MPFIKLVATSLSKQLNFSKTEREARKTFRLSASMLKPLPLNIANIDRRKIMSREKLENSKIFWFFYNSAGCNLLQPAFDWLKCPNAGRFTEVDEREVDAAGPVFTVRTGVWLGNFCEGWPAFDGRGGMILRRATGVRRSD